MPERPHPEGRSTEQLRPIVEIVGAREKVRRSIEADSYMGEEFVSNISSQDLILDDPQTEETLRNVLPVEMQLSRAIGWNDGLDYVFGESCFMIGKVDAYPGIVIPQASRPYEKLEQARNTVSDTVKATMIKKWGICGNYNRLLKERASTSIDGHLDQQMLFGETKTPPTRAEHFLKLDIRENVQAVMLFEKGIGLKESLDWVLGEEDENNGLARMLAEQRGNPPRE